MSDYLLVVDRVAPIDEGDLTAAGAALGRALTAARHTVRVLGVISPEHAARIPGLARRLRTVTVSVGGRARELPLFEGRSAAYESQLLLLGTGDSDRGSLAAILTSAAMALAQDGLPRPDAVLAWGETAAPALEVLDAGFRAVVLPDGKPGSPLDANDAAALAALPVGSVRPHHLLSSVGAHDAQAIVVPGPSSAATLARHPDLAGLATRVRVVRFGSDDAPNDPSADPTLPTPYDARNPGGKQDARRELLRRAGVTASSRTLLTAVLPPADLDARRIAEILEGLLALDVVLLLTPEDRALTEKLRAQAIAHPTRMAILPDATPPTRRLLLAGADAALLLDAADPTGRAAAAALRRGTLPIVAAGQPIADHLIDYDPASATGCAVHYDDPSRHGIEGAVRRALALRAVADGWSPVLRATFAAAPTWAATVSSLDALRG